MIRLVLRHLPFLCILPSLVSWAIIFLSISNSSMLQVLTGLFLRFLRMLEFAMRFSEFLLRRPVLFIASTLFDSSLSTLLDDFDVSLALHLRSCALCNHEFPGQFYCCGRVGLSPLPLASSAVFCNIPLCRPFGTVVTFDVSHQRSFSTVLLLLVKR